MTTDSRRPAPLALIATTVLVVLTLAGMADSGAVDVPWLAAAVGPVFDVFRGVFAAVADTLRAAVAA